MKKISLTIQENITTDLKSGMSSRVIASKYKVSQSSVARIAKTIKEDLPPSHSGHPSKLSKTTRHSIIRDITSGNLQNAVQAQEYLSTHLNITVSTNRVRQILKEEGMTTVRLTKGPKLTPKHIKQRMDFVHMYEDWTVDDWKLVLWTDETRINRIGSDGNIWAWKNPRNPNQKRLYDETVKHGGGSVFLWGCFSYYGPGFISRIHGNMDASLYIEILDECVPLTQEYYDIDPQTMKFQQDNDSKHTSKLAKEFFEANDYDLIIWPANSPDLNPIEHLWHYVKQQLQKYELPPRGVNELWERIQEVWDNIPIEVCQNLVESMPNRIQAVKKAKGGHTHY